MVDLTKMIQGGLDLAKAFGGDDQAYRSTMAKQAQVEGLIVDAANKRDERVARQNAPEAIRALGGNPDLATILRAGYDPSKLGLGDIFAGAAPNDVRSFRMMTEGLSHEDRERARRINLGLDGRASGAAIGYQKITGPDGREYLVATDPRGIGAQVVGSDTSFGSFAGQQRSAQAPQPQRADMEADIELANSMIAAGIPEAQVDAFLAQRGQRAPAPSAGQGMPSRAGNQFASRRPEDQAAATERAKLQAQLDALPQELAMRGQAAVSQAVGIEQGKAQVDRQNVATTRQTNAGRALDLLGEAERLLDQATGGRFGAAGDAVAGAFGYSTAGAQANAALATIAGQLTAQMPRMEGPQSDRDVQMYKEMAGDLANPNLPIQTRLAALQQIRLMQEKSLRGQQALPAAPAQQQPQARPAAAPVQRARNPQTGQVVEFRNGQWVPVQ